MTWADDQKWEREWWGDCVNTFNEEYKQLLYARLMGLKALQVNGRDPVYDMEGKTVLDIGGGPVSMLLKCKNLGLGAVVDPCRFPSWVYSRYSEVGILPFVTPAENIDQEWAGMAEHMKISRFDEVWIYNVLQHVMDPHKIIQNARKFGKRIRIVEWVGMPATTGHPHELHVDKLNEWLGGKGEKMYLNQNNCIGMAYVGIFDY